MTRTTFAQQRQGKSLAKLVAPVMLAGLAALILSSWSGVVLAAQDGPALWPAYYNGTEVTIMMGPADNSSRPGAGTGPDVSKARQPLPLMYALGIPTATQMIDHDMVLTAVPGDPDYNAKISVVWCVASKNFWTGPLVYKSETAVLDGIAADEIDCFNIGVVRFAQVVGK